MRVFLLVLDSLGIGGASDAALYGDEGSNTYAAIAEGCDIPNLRALGLDRIDGVAGVGRAVAPRGQYGRMAELSCGKDTVTGHFEIAGLITEKPYPTYPHGFDAAIIDELRRLWGTEILGNKAASGTAIINELGDLHMATGAPIVYTSADSVMQIACCETLYPPRRLYEMCAQARALMCGDRNVGRIIARPFLPRGDGTYYRTDNRRDFSVRPFALTVLDELKATGRDVVGIGKIRDIFSGQGLTAHTEAHGNEEVGAAVLQWQARAFDGLVFANFVDFDMLYGHRNDVAGYRACLERFDVFLGKFLAEFCRDGLLIITADHGCDPSTPSTDHSREDVPILLFGASAPPQNLGTLRGFDYVAQRIRAAFGLI